MAFTFKTTSDYQDTARSYSNTPPGWYEATVLSAVEKCSRGGSPMIELNLGVEVGRMKPLELRSWLVLTTAAAWKIEQFLAATGMKFRAGEDMTISAPACEGKKLCLTLYNRVTDKGNLFPDILDFRRREDCPHMGKMSDEELELFMLKADGTRKEFVAEVRKELNKPEPAQPRTTGPARAYEMSDDDIPF